MKKPTTFSGRLEYIQQITTALSDNAAKWGVPPNLLNDMRNHNTSCIETAEACTQDAGGTLEARETNRAARNMCVIRAEQFIDSVVKAWALKQHHDKILSDYDVEHTLGFNIPNKNYGTNC